MSVPKLLEVKIGLLGKRVCERDYRGGKNWPFVESQCAEGTLRKFWYFVENGAFGKNECKKRTLW